MKLINMKAPQQQVDFLSDTKTNKVDTEQILDSINIVHKQLKQAIVLFIDSIKT
jgi:hypothetical protein